MALTEEHVDVDSTTPLLPERGRNHDDDAPEDDGAPPGTFSLPSAQILLLCYARLMEPLAFYSIFPYIHQMTQVTGNLAEADIGFYSGLFESLFAAAQALVLVPWGSTADRIGGKTALVYSLVGMSVGPVLFGLSSSLWQMAIFRCFTGLVAGGGVVIRAMIGERCDRQNLSQALSWYSLTGNVALFLGPLMGGALADPVSQYPKLFGGVEFLERFPFALPGFVMGAMSAIAAVVVVFFVRDVEYHDEQGLHDDFKAAPGKLSWTLVREIITAPGVGAVLAAFLHIMVIGAGFMAIGNLALYTGVARGGMGFSPHHIAGFLMVQGVAEAFWLLLVFPSLHRRTGTKGVLMICALGFPLYFADYIVMNALLREGSPAATLMYHIALGGVLIIAPAAWMVITAAQIALQEASPSPRTLGTLGGIADSCSSVVRSIVPPLSTSLFAVGVKDQVMGGYLVWVVLMVLGVTLPVTLMWLPAKMRA